MRGRILASLELGLAVERACQHVGICKYTFYDWLKKGREGQEPYATFFEQAAISRGKAEAKYLRRMAELSEQNEHLPTAFSATGWVLERQFQYRKPKDEAPVEEVAETEPTTVAIVYEGAASADPQD